MVIPNLIHPVPVFIERIDKAATTFDPDSQEPLQQASRKTEVRVVGQVKWASEKNLAQQAGGARAEADGYVLFRNVDLIVSGTPFEIQIGDRFTKIGTLKTNVYVTRIRPTIHYTDQDGHTAIKAFFKDRSPSKLGVS